MYSIDAIFHVSKHMYRNVATVMVIVQKGYRKLGISPLIHSCTLQGEGSSAIELTITAFHVDSMPISTAFIPTTALSPSILRQNACAFTIRRPLIHRTPCSTPVHFHPTTFRIQIRASSPSSTPDDPIPQIPPPEKASLTPSSRRFIWTRLAIFTSMALTYAAYVFLRSTFTYVAPVMSQSLALSLPAIGKITSAFPLAYGMSRLFTGVLVDRTAPHRALCVGLLLAGLLNVAMGTCSSVGMLAALWAVNGLVQGVGAGASAKMLTAWFSPQQRGLYWALWSTSANVGAFLAPVVCARLAMSAGFRYGLILPGIVTAAWAALMLPLLRSTPRDAGLIADWEQPPRPTTTSLEGADAEGKKAHDKAEWRDIFVNGVLKNKTIWMLAVSYFFVYLVRNGTKSWLHFWLAEVRGLNAAEAAYRVSGMEIGGIAGTFSAGIVSDWMGGRRVVVTILYLVGMMAALGVAWAMPAGMAVADFAAFAAAGFMINGPQMMIGLIGAEVCDRRVMATATGVLGWISYLGAAASGFPLSVLIRKGGWSLYFPCLIASCACAILCLAPMWGLKATSAKKDA